MMKVKKEIQMMDTKQIQKIGVIGSGTMGPGIAQTFARAGYEVFLVDLNDEILERGIQRIQDSLDIFIETEVIEPEEKDVIISRIVTTTDIKDVCRRIDYYMEVLPEVLELKQNAHRDADKWCADHVILASNASNMKIEEIASVTKRPDRVVGTHWVNPPHIMQLVEIVKGSSTSQDTVDTVKNLLEGIGKAPIVCKSTLSFLNNAMQSAITRTAIDLLEKKIATAEDIDKAVNTGFGFRLPMVGPLAFLDMAGLDNVRDGWKYLDKVSGGGRGPIPSFIQELIDKGHLGVKTGKGIFEYSKNIKEVVKDRDRKLIYQLKALGRI
jgi:3-hydroxybutyryl-CoA dehydrogenase